MKLRNFHRTLGLCVFIFLLNSAITGLLRANAKWWYWKDRPAKAETVSLLPPAVSVEEVFNIYGAKFPRSQLCRIEFKSLLGKPVYLLETNDSLGKYILMDADSGKILSPINLDLAIDVARLFVSENDKVALSESLPSFKGRKTNEARPVFRILFKDASETEVLVDQETAQPIVVLDRGRRLGLWIVKLHELDFAGISRWALTLSGAAIVILSLTGFVLGLKTKKVIKKEKMYS